MSASETPAARAAVALSCDAPEPIFYGSDAGQPHTLRIGNLRCRPC